VETSHSPSFHLSQSPWISKDSTEENSQDWKERLSQAP
jgi:hypothetical protein